MPQVFLRLANMFSVFCIFEQVLRFQQKISNILLMKLLRRTRLQFWNYAIERMVVVLFWLLLDSII